MRHAVPSISTQGWLTTIGEKADRLLCYFFANEYSQSVSYYEQISSLPFLIAKYTSDPKRLEASVDASISTMLLSFFDNAEVNVRVEADDANETSHTIYLHVRLIDNGVGHEIGKAITFKDSKIQKIQKIVNG